MIIKGIINISKEKLTFCFAKNFIKGLGKEENMMKKVNVRKADTVDATAWWIVI